MFILPHIQPSKLVSTQRSLNQVSWALGGRCSTAVTHTTRRCGTSFPQISLIVSAEEYHASVRRNGVEASSCSRGHAAAMQQWRPRLEEIYWEGRTV